MMQLPCTSSDMATQHSKGNSSNSASHGTAARSMPDGKGAASNSSSPTYRSKSGQLQDAATGCSVRRSSASTLSLGNTLPSSAAPSAATSQQGGAAGGPPAFKACRKCGVTREASCFQMDRHNVDGLQSYCRSCKAERARERRSEKETLPPAQVDAAGSSVGGSKPVRRTASRARLSQPQTPEASPPWGGLKLADSLSTRNAAWDTATGAARDRPPHAARTTAAAVLPPVLPGHKRCSRCRVAKPRADFHCNRTTADGLQYQCRTCHQEAIGSRAANAGRQTAAKRRASTGQAEAARKPKSRRLSDFSDVATSTSRDDDKPDGFALLQRAAAVALAQDWQQDADDLQQRAAGAPAAVQQRKRAAVMHKLCSKCHTLKPASDFWKNKSTADGLQWFCRACQTRVCHTLKDAARLRNAASQAAADAEGLHPVTPALKAGGNRAVHKRKGAGRPSSVTHRRTSGGHGARRVAPAAPGSPGLHALLAAGSAAAADEGFGHGKTGDCSINLKHGNVSAAPAAARLTLQDVLRVAPHGLGSPAVATAGAAAAATQQPVAASWPPAMHAGRLTDDEAYAAEIADSGPLHDADSGVSDDGSSEHEEDEAIVRTSTTGSNSLQIIMEACRQESAITAERTRLSCQLLAVAPLLMPDVLRLRTAPGEAAMRAVLQRGSPGDGSLSNLPPLHTAPSQPSGRSRLVMDAGGPVWRGVQPPGAAAAAAARFEPSDRAGQHVQRRVTAPHSGGGLGSPLLVCGGASLPGAGSAMDRPVLQAVPELHSAVQSTNLLPLMLLLSNQRLERAR